VKVRLPASSWVRAALVLPFLVATVVLLWWRGPDWGTVIDAFTFVHWWWIVVALGLNLLSVLVRAMAWRTVVNQALPDPHPLFPQVFSAFAVGLLANAVLPGRIGELARVAVLTRKQPRGRGDTARLVGTVVAHRLFDLIPAVLLLAYVLLTARVPRWAIVSLVLVTAVGAVLFVFALASARLKPGSAQGVVGPVRRLWEMGRQGLEVMNAPLAAVVAALYQCVGWFFQLLAVYVAMRAFGIHAPLHAAGLVLLLMNVATIFPLWPGNIGLLQAAVALPLVSYGVAYARGFAYGLGLQVLEMSVGVGVGLLFLAREGLSFAMLKGIQEEGEASPSLEETVEDDVPRPRARMPG